MPIITWATPGSLPGASFTAPLILSVGQARDNLGSPLVVVTVRPPDTVSSPIQSVMLARATSQSGSGVILADQRTPSPYSRWINLFDVAPLYGQRAYYQATLDNGTTTNTVYFSAVLNPIAPTPASISQGAFGPYPLLGSDVYLDPTIGEGVIGPNGDLLSVNGLELLAQDLRTRLITTQGELLLHPEFGLTRQRIIGSGQGDPVGQAQILQTRIIDVLELDPRVDRVENVQIQQVAMDAWTVTVTLVAIGAEDAGLMNLVFPYFLG